MQSGTTFSGIGHAGVILWVLVGDWFFAPDPVPIVTTDFTVISEDEYDEMMKTATEVVSEDNASVKPQARPEPVVEPEPEPKPVPEPVPEPDPEPVVEPPPSEAAQAEVEQPLDSTSTEIQPVAEAEAIVSPDPVAVEPEAETSDNPTPAVSDQPADAPAVEEPPTVEAAPKDTAPTLATEETEEQDAETGMTASIRPKSRPEKPAVAQAPEPEEVPAETPDDPVEKQPEEPAEQPVDDAETDAAIDALLGEAVEEEVEEPAPESSGATAEVGEQNLPQGPPMSGSEKEAVASAIGRCWSTGSLSTAATRVKIVVRVEMSPDGTPLSVELVDFRDGDQAAANNAFQPVRRAVMRSVAGCKGGAGLTLDPAKYGEWNVITLMVDGSGVLLR